MYTIYLHICLQEDLFDDESSALIHILVQLQGLSKSLDGPVKR